MIIDSIKKIRSLEEDLEKRIQEAERAANESYRKTQEDAEEEAKEIISNAKKEGEGIVNKRKLEAEKLSDELLEKGEKEFHQMKNLTDEQLKEAVDFVLERIVIWYGNSQNASFQTLLSKKSDEWSAFIFTKLWKCSY